VNEASLRVSPVRWSPKSGHLEMVTRMRLQLTLADDPHPDVVQRLRVVPEWEDDPAAIPTGRRAATLTSMRSNAKGKAEPFAAEQLPSVLGSPVQYVIITNQAQAAQFQRLADWKTQSGVPAVVRTIEYIRQQYVAGVDDAERVRNF